MSEKKTTKTKKAAKVHTPIKDLPAARNPKGGRGGWDGNHNAVVA
jgi:hypothetical protein